MRRILWILVIALVILGTGVLTVHAAATVCQVFNGCTGTGSIPAVGQVLVGQGNGTYAPQATSTLGISGGSGAVSSVFGRTGAVAAQSGDYTTSQVTEGSNLYFTATRAIAALFGWPFTPTSYGVSTSTVMGFTNGIVAAASSTIGDGTANGGLTISGDATTTGDALVQGILTATQYNNGDGSLFNDGSAIYYPGLNVPAFDSAGINFPDGSTAISSAGTYNYDNLGNFIDGQGDWLSIGGATILDGNGNLTSGNCGSATTPGLGLLGTGHGVYCTGDNDLDFATESTPRMRIDPAGNVMIGTSTASARLEAWGSDTTAGDFAFLVANNASTTEFSVDDAGNVKIAGNASTNGALTSPQATITNASTTNITFSQSFGSGNSKIPAEQYPSFSVATSTAWIGTTTTISLGIATVNETWDSIQCSTDAGSVNLQFNSGASLLNMVSASTTVGTQPFTTNNTFTAGTKRTLTIGTPASSPIYVGCTVSKHFTF